MRPLRLLLTVAAATTVAGCVTKDESSETLPPLVTGAVTESTDSVAESAAADAETFATPLSVEPTVPQVAATSSTLEPRPVGDWDDAKFDVGRITGTTEVGEFPAILFDRYSYQDPQAGAIDASGFREEPVRFWWVDEPFFNQSTNVRRFVLAPDVEVLVLSDAGESEACTSPPPANLPRPTWTLVELSFLDSENATQAFASLTYTQNGLVERIRFTRGC